jgi:hypothetical protein
LLHQGRPASLEIGVERDPGLGLQGDVEGLAPLAAPEADEPALEVEVLEPQQPVGVGNPDSRSDQPGTIG